MPTGRLAAEQHHAAEAGVAPDAHHARSAMTSNVTAGESDFSMPSCVLDGLGDLIAVAAVDGLF
jgi:hypothetical protein